MKNDENIEKIILLKNGKNVYGQKMEILITGEKIQKIAEEISEKEIEILGKNIEIKDLGKKLLMPGIIDIHTHMRDPGITHKEDFETGSKACAKGGITTFYDMPNTVPTTTTLKNLLLKKKEQIV